MPNRQCSHVFEDGRRCRSFAITEEGLCRSHAMTPEQRIEEARHRQALQVRARRKKNDPHHDLHEFMTERLLSLVCRHLQSENLSEQFVGVYTAALVTGLFETPMTPTEFRAAMNERLPTHLRNNVRPLPEPWETRRAARRAWYEGHLRHSPIVGLYIAPVPEHLLEEGKSAEDLIRDEAPDLIAADVREVNGNDSVIKAVRPDGSETLVPTDRPEPPSHYAKVHRLASIALERRKELSAPR